MRKPNLEKTLRHHIGDIAYEYLEHRSTVQRRTPGAELEMLVRDLMQGVKSPVVRPAEKVAAPAWDWVEFQDDWEPYIERDASVTTYRGVVEVRDGYRARETGKNSLLSGTYPTAEDAARVRFLAHQAGRISEAMNAAIICMQKYPGQHDYAMNVVARYDENFDKPRPPIYEAVRKALIDGQHCASQHFVSIANRAPESIYATPEDLPPMVFPEDRVPMVVGEDDLVVRRDVIKYDE